MEKKCICPGVNVIMCGCGSFGCEPEPEPTPEPESTGTLSLTIGETGDFKTLREAQEYIRQRVCTRAVINLVSDVKEEAGEGIYVHGFLGDPITLIFGNGHTLDLSNMKTILGLGVFAQRLNLNNIRIYSPNTTFSVLTIGHCSQLSVCGNVTIQGGGKEKSQRGVHMCDSGDMLVHEKGSVIKDCTTGVSVNANGRASLTDPLTFTNVTTEFSPVKDTVGNRNSYVAINY